MCLGKKARWVSKEIEPKKTSKECLWELAEQEKTSIVVIGSHGRKGPKLDETVLGSAVQYLSLSSKFPVLIMKDRKPRSEKPDGCLRYGVCFDTSDKSKKTLLTVLKMMKPQDKLTTITVRYPDMISDDALKQYVQSECAKYKISKVECTILDAEVNKSIYQVIKHYLKYEAQDVDKHGYIDFVAVGNQGMDFTNKNTEKYLGSVANAVIRAKKMNVIFIS